MVPIAGIPKVPKAEFEAAIRALLNTPATPATAITNKRPRKADSMKPGPTPKRPVQ